MGKLDDIKYYVSPVYNHHDISITKVRIKLKENTGLFYCTSEDGFSRSFVTSSEFLFDTLDDAEEALRRNVDHTIAMMSSKLETICRGSVENDEQ